MDALDGLDLNGNGDDDEYDFMDESDDEARGGQQPRRSKIKYMNLLQDVVDRKIDHVLIDLDDLNQVCFFVLGFFSFYFFFFGSPFCNVLCGLVIAYRLHVIVAV